MMAEAAISLDSDSGSSVKLISSSDQQDSSNSAENGENSVPSEEINGKSFEQITESLDQLSTKSLQSSSEESDDEQYRKKARVGNHYQARIPKFSSSSLDCPSEDELLWDPFIIDSDTVESFLKRIASISKLLLPMGNHLRDDEEALYILQKNSHDVESAVKIVSENQTLNPDKMSVWSEEECRNFERGLLNFGKNFFLIQKYRVTSRRIGELVQFYYLWKKTERYDLFATRMRTGKKKYSLNPGISDLMCRYLGRQMSELGTVPSDVQFLVTNGGKDVQENSQY